MKKRAESEQSGLWGYETSSGIIPLPQLSHGEKTQKEKKKLRFHAVNFAALQTGLSGKCGAIRLADEYKCSLSFDCENTKIIAGH